MMQKTSLNKNIALNLFGFSFVKNLPVSIVASILVLLVSPVYLVNIINDALGRNDMRVNYIYSIDTYVLPFLLCGLAIVATAVGLMLLFTNFNFLFNKQSADTYHALPLKRSGLFLARFSASFCAALIPLTVGYLGTFFVGFMDRVELSNKLLLTGFIFTVIFMAVCLLSSMLIILLTGCVFDAIVALIALNIGLPICVLPFDEIANNLIFGYASSNLTENAFVYGTPFGYSLSRLSDIISEPIEKGLNITELIIAFLIIAILFFVIVKVYNIRKSEKSGEAFAFGFVPYVISAIISTLGFFVLGSIFFGGLETYNPAFWIIGIIGAFLCGVVYNAVVYRGFKKIKFSFIPSAVAVLMVGIITIGLAVDAFCIERYLPNADNVNVARVAFGGEEISVKQKDMEYVIEFHKSIIDQKDAVEILDEDINGGEYHSVRFEYSLKGGKEVNRRYYIPANKFAEEFAEFISGPYANYFEENYVPADYDYFNISGDFAKSKEGGGYYSCTITRQEVETLLSLYIDDLRNVTAQDIKFGIRDKESSFHVNMFTKTVDERYAYFYSYIKSEEFESIKYIKGLDLLKRTELEEKGSESVTD